MGKYIKLSIKFLDFHYRVQIFSALFLLLTAVSIFSFFIYEGYKSSPAKAATCNWIEGNGDNKNAFQSANWDCGSTSSANDYIVNNTSTDITWDLSGGVNITFGSGYTGTTTLATTATISGDITVDGGTFDLDTNKVTFNGDNFTVGSGAKVTASSGSDMVMRSGNGVLGGAGSMTFDDLQIGVSLGPGTHAPTVTLAGDVQVNGDFDQRRSGSGTLTNTFSMSSHTLTVEGLFYVGKTSGAGNQTFVFNANSGTLIAKGYAEIRDYSGTGSVTFDGDTATLDFRNQLYIYNSSPSSNVVFNAGTSGALSVQGTTTVQTETTGTGLTSLNGQSKDIKLHGGLDMNVSATYTADVEFTPSTATNDINKSLIINQQGASGATLIFGDPGGVYTLNASSSVNITDTSDGSISFSPATSTNGTFILDGNGDEDQFLTYPAGTSFYNLTLNNTGSSGTNDIIPTANNLLVRNNLTITDGDLDLGTNNISLYTSSTFAIGANGEFTKGNSTTTFDGASPSFNDAAGVDLGNVLIDGASSSFSLSSALTSDNLFIGADDSFDAATSTLTISGNYQNNGTFTKGTQAVTFDNTTQTSITSGGFPFGTLTFNGSGGTFALQDTLRASSTLTVSAGTLDLNNNNLSYDASLLLTGGFTKGTGTTTANASGFVINNTGGEVDLGNYAIEGSATTATLSTAAVAFDNLTIQSGSTLVSGSNDISISGNYTNSGTYTSGVNTTTFDGTGSVSITPGSSAFNNLTFNQSGATFTPNAALDINGNLTITAGALAAGGNAIVLDGDWINNDAFTHGGNTVTLNGTNQTLYGTTTFNNLAKTPTAVDTLTFENGNTQTIEGTLTLTGVSSSNLLSLRSTATGTPWLIDPQSTVSVSNLDVQDSTNSNATAIECTTDCTDSGSNTNWTFTVAVPSVEESTPSTSGGGGGAGIGPITFPNAPIIVVPEPEEEIPIEEPEPEKPTPVEPPEEPTEVIPIPPLTDPAPPPVLPVEPPIVPIEPIPIIPSEEPSGGSPEAQEEPVTTPEPEKPEEGERLEETPVFENPFELPTIPTISLPSFSFPSIDIALIGKAITTIASTVETAPKKTYTLFSSLVNPVSDRLAGYFLNQLEQAQLRTRILVDRTKAIKTVPPPLPSNELVVVTPLGSLDVTPEHGEKVEVIPGEEFILYYRPSRPVNSITATTLFTSSLSRETVKSPLFRLILKTAKPAVAKEYIVDETSYTDEDGDGLWEAVIILPSVEGDFVVETAVDYVEGEDETIVREFLIDPKGYVFIESSLGIVRLENTTVTLFKLNTFINDFELWNAGAYGQRNPQITDRTGEYSFLVPAGTYRLTAEKHEFNFFQSESFEVSRSAPVHMNIELEREGFFTRWVTNSF